MILDQIDLLLESRDSTFKFSRINISYFLSNERIRDNLPHVLIQALDTYPTNPFYITVQNFYDKQTIDRPILSAILSAVPILSVTSFIFNAINLISNSEKRIVDAVYRALDRASLNKGFETSRYVFNNSRSKFENEINYFKKLVGGNDVILSPDQLSEIMNAYLIFLTVVVCSLTHELSKKVKNLNNVVEIGNVGSEFIEIKHAIEIYLKFIDVIFSDDSEKKILFRRILNKSIVLK